MGTDTEKRALIAMHSDLPRIIRKDMTEVTEAIAKYQGFASDFDGLGLEDVVEQLVQLRIELEGAAERVSAGSGAGGPVGPDVQTAETTVVSELGKPISVITALVQGGFVSRLDVAKRGIEQGYVEVDGVKIEDVDAQLDIGEYRLKCGEVVQSIRVQ